MRGDGRKKIIFSPKCLSPHKIPVNLFNFDPKKKVLLPRIENTSQYGREYRFGNCL